MDTTKVESIDRVDHPILKSSQSIKMTESRLKHATIESTDCCADSFFAMFENFSASITAVSDIVTLSYRISIG